MPRIIRRPDGSIGATLTASDEKRKAAKSQLNAADLDAAKKAIEAASTVADLKSTLAEVVELVARLAEAQGLEPKTPSVEAMP